MATRLEELATAFRVELYTQWQTHGNGVHMRPEVFDAIDFTALATAGMTSLGIEDVHGETNRE